MQIVGRRLSEERVLSLAQVVVNALDEYKNEGR